jgi:hypothetical protein
VKDFSTDSKDLTPDTAKELKRAAFERSAYSTSLSLGLLPILDLDHVPFGINDILKGQQPQPRYVSYGKLTDGGTAIVKDRLHCGGDIIDCKGNMRESRCIRMDGRVLWHGAILKEFEGWSIVSVARKAKVCPGDV